MKLYKNDAERAMHRRAIESLATEMHHAVHDVEAVYEAELQQVKATARIEDFVPTFTRRRTVSTLRGRPRGR